VKAAPVLVTGGSGQLGSALSRLATSFQAEGMDLVVASRPHFDFDHPGAIPELFAQVAPALVINTAAWTAVDAAETNQDAAFRANEAGPALLAQLCAASAVPLIHLSTDYVFDGSKGAPYRETDPTSPLGVYGRSKLAGEQAVQRLWDRSIILRTSWVYGPMGKNFILTMLNAARKTNVLRVVADQFGNPTATPDLARTILGIARRLRQAGWDPAFGGVFHATGTGGTSWHEFASAAFSAAAPLGLPMPEVQPIATADWPTPTKRPADSRLDCTRLAEAFDLRLPHWEESLRPIVGEILAS
jgi:dTDP-4-dehydrorhamnose reductase